MAHIKKEGYAQLELNNAAFRRSGRIEAQCKIADGIEYLENGMLLAVNNAKRQVEFVNEDNKHLPVALHYSSEHMYDNRANALKDFKLDPNSFLPRLGYLGAGDKYTTNCVDYAGTEPALWEAISNGTVLYAHAGTDGYHLVNTTAEGAIALVIGTTTMPDGQMAIKFQAL
jgi:hypothetical protein